MFVCRIAPLLRSFPSVTAASSRCTVVSSARQSAPQQQRIQAAPLSSSTATNNAAASSSSTSSSLSAADFFVLPPLSPQVKKLLQGFYEWVPINIAWGHQDIFAHVNNAHYIRWCEAGRIHWITQLGKTSPPEFKQLNMAQEVAEFMAGKTTGPILKSIFYNFQSAVTYPDSIIVGSRLHSLSKDRFSLTHRLVSLKQERVVGDAEGIIVTFDYVTQNKADIPAPIRAALQQRLSEQNEAEKENPMQKPPRASINYDVNTHHKK